MFDSNTANYQFNAIYASSILPCVWGNSYVASTIPISRHLHHRHVDLLHFAGMTMRKDGNTTILLEIHHAADISIPLLPPFYTPTICLPFQVIEYTSMLR